MTNGGLAATLAAIDGVDGWLSDDQVARLFERGRDVPPGGRIVEIGSYHGRSTIVLASTAKQGTQVIAIDPHAGNDRGPRQIEGTAEAGEEDREAFERNLRRAGVREPVIHIRKRSDDALADIDGAIDLLYVDGAHRFGPALSDIERWGARVRPGGTMLIHDAFSSIGVTLAQLRLLLASPDFVYVGRSRSLAEYRRVAGRLGLRARVANASRQLTELKWFARNIAIKLALVAGVRPAAARLGNEPGDEWPY
jgi:predicted O-methyltransferase YrrM